MNQEIAKDIREKIIKGLHLAFEKLLLIKQKEDSELVFSKNGQIITIRARDFKKWVFYLLSLTKIRETLYLEQKKNKM